MTEIDLRQKMCKNHRETIGFGTQRVPSWRRLGGGLAVLASSWDRLGRSRGRIGADLGGLGAALGSPWAVFEPSWRHLGAILGVLEPSWGRIGREVEYDKSSMMLEERSRTKVCKNHWKTIGF